MIKVPYQADTHRLFVGPVVRCLAVCSRKLATPPERNLNLAVAAVGSIAYDKIVADSLPVPYFPVLSVKNTCIAVVRA